MGTGLMGPIFILVIQEKGVVSGEGQPESWRRRRVSRGYTFDADSKAATFNEDDSFFDNVPDSWDWTSFTLDGKQGDAVSPLKSQGTCEGCVSFAVASQLESAQWLSTNKIYPSGDNGNGALTTDASSFSAKPSQGELLKRCP